MRDTEAVAIYGDHDMLDALGRRRSPAFKPDWNEPYFLAYDYIGWAVAVSRAAAIDAGGFRHCADGQEMSDLLLRLYEPDSGTILLDDQPIDTIEPGALRAAIGVVAADVDGRASHFSRGQRDRVFILDRHSFVTRHVRAGYRAHLVVRASSKERRDGDRQQGQANGHGLAISNS